MAKGCVPLFAMLGSAEQRGDIGYVQKWERKEEKEKWGVNSCCAKEELGEYSARVNWC